MSDEPSNDSSPTTDSDLHFSIVLEFERAWSAGQRPDIKSFWKPDAGHATALLQHLIHVDMERRLKQGDTRVSKTMSSSFHRSLISTACS